MNAANSNAGSWHAGLVIATGLVQGKDFQELRSYKTMKAVEFLVIVRHGETHDPLAE
jgi:hypothetical protein